ncbi:Sensor protein KdpD [Methylobacterium crusticola]|uniref:histidine kinase n=1 Tax=Methylobacterium crusticola TaxID=1697972 RepID=A0ABQ4QQ75_9HYPH|nr:HAMP domain-containing sensor histidine kinase [Methylobacterium crusticola]GJD47428.1 Sensor protein KdpD [Methylobacterium crusticola]
MRPAVAMPERAPDEALMRAEADRSAMARLLAVAGHDLKQPLQVALLSIERAVSDGVAPGAARRLGLASNALRRLGRELDDLARSSQAGGGTVPRSRAVRLDRVLARVEDEWRAYAEACGVRLRVRASGLGVRTDAGMLTTILRNLVGNAVKYARRGGRVVVGARRRGGRVVVEVHDDGPGIAPVRLAGIFEAFDRGGRRDAGGLGLGLHIVRQTAEALGHPVGVRSVPDRGSAFWVTLPRAGAPAARPGR